VSVLTAVGAEGGQVLVERSGLPDATAWTTHQDRLARELPRDKWNLVSGGYALYETLVTLGEANLARQFDQVTEAAVVELRRAHRAVAGRASHRAAERTWDRQRASSDGM
jgi:hypothetical protein